MSEKKQSTRDGFGVGLLEIAANNPNVVGLCADLTESTRMQAFADKYPERFFQVGVAEQNMIGVAAGLALAGKIPFAASYAAFQPANSWGVIRTSVAYSNLNVKMVSSHAGLATGPDGATHQSLEDIALMRVLPNMTVIVPADFEEARRAAHSAAKLVGPVYIQLSRYGTEPITVEKSTFQIGRSTRLLDGIDVAFISSGAILSNVLAAARKLAEIGIHARVINMSTIKPLDKTAIFEALSQTKMIITVEDQQVSGGLGSAVCEMAAGVATDKIVHRIGINDSFGESGLPEELLKKYHLDDDSIFTQTQELLAKFS
ncbi:MAG: transketolase [Candidatus Pacebacteria bacterium CG10_big_fil_rev_8_21_14_0_10_42_12]|nr:transketolase family protein [Candidatus Paceibacterota bacterium]PIR62157.1 MAG: transketolase [Candidatus Pacebacteria bacterium CG10_big_fil_rev_8_21_14_0_10_42_12]